MLNIYCDECQKEGQVEYEDSDYDTVFIVHCPYCGVEISLPDNEFFYDLNIDWEEYERMVQNGEI